MGCTGNDAAISAQGASLEMADIVLNMDLKSVVKQISSQDSHQNITTLKAAKLNNQFAVTLPC